MDEEHYTDLDPDKFVFVCKLCHKCISALEQIKPENRKKIRKADWADFFGRFLST